MCIYLFLIVLSCSRAYRPYRALVNIPLDSAVSVFYVNFTSLLFKKLISFTSYTVGWNKLIKLWNEWSILRAPFFDLQRGWTLLAWKNYKGNANESDRGNLTKDCFSFPLNSIEKLDFIKNPTCFLLTEVLVVITAVVDSRKVFSVTPTGFVVVVVLLHLCCSLYVRDEKLQILVNLWK